MAVLGLLLSLPLVIAAKKINYGDVQITHLNPQKTDAKWVRTKQVSPKYPVKFVKKRVAGCGIFKFTVNEDGKAQNIELITSFPDKHFFKNPATKVIEKFDWTNVSGQPNQAENKLVRLDFCMGGNSLDEAQALCVKQTKLQCG